ncbi:hypothetical protein TcCL_ESM08941 [Trypanosoma cruzi]|nr:hypothetical protein TcCL_ESM08941 [Trypanosoma cruzi]
MGPTAVSCGAPRAGVLGENEGFSTRTTKLAMLRNAADQRAMCLEINSRRVSKMTLSRSAASRALATTKKTAAVRCCGPSRRMASLRRSNRSRVELSGQQQDRSRANWSA